MQQLVAYLVAYLPEGSQRPVLGFLPGCVIACQICRSFLDERGIQITPMYMRTT